MQQKIWEQFSGPNLAYMLEMYEQYERDKETVEPSIAKIFQTYGAPKLQSKQIDEQLDVNVVTNLLQIVTNIRTYGHLGADIHPLKEKEEVEILKESKRLLSVQAFQEIPASAALEHAPPHLTNGAEVIRHLQKVYTATITFEFTHIYDQDERKWLEYKVETEGIPSSLATLEKKQLLQRLIEVEEFEQFLHKTFVGQKRFSIEGIDVLVPMLDEAIRCASKEKIHKVAIGMAHRGRLSVLAHTLKKPYQNIFSEFLHVRLQSNEPNQEELLRDGWTGDVKYHLGAVCDVTFEENEPVRVILANNPSHLEFVNPIVEGLTRAAQEDRSQKGMPRQDVDQAAPILIHGDGAFPGEGVVAETLNLSQLKGYYTGGTIHIIANNEIGFTTDSEDDRSTTYASDLAKGFGIPIIHVNADQPESCIAAIRFAMEYRNRFHKDILIDLIGYRRFGHNEMDDPAVTQPLLYQKIAKHPTVVTIYGNYLMEQGVIVEHELEEIKKNIRGKLLKEYEFVKEHSAILPKVEPSAPLQERPPRVETSVPQEELRDINQNLLLWSDEITLNPKLEKILKRRKDAFELEKKVDWGHAEILAFATILADGIPVRLTGQDSERGTFAHRHLVLHDQKTNKTFSPLHILPQAKASFAIHNSPLSEVAVLGFEYGYSIFAEEALVLWEAQFGDFVNVAQVIIDQFITSARAKWGEKSALVLLLPHGYEGQGPEHSSARMERFLQLAAENNCIVANLTSAAQYFHILRRQALISKSEQARPLFIMTPKSLLRNPKVASNIEQLSNSAFKEIIEEPLTGTNANTVTRLIFCSGKIAIDLITGVEKKENKERFHIIRLEQLYPFPAAEIAEVLSKYKNVQEIVWAQEEPQNMGAWTFVEPRLKQLANGKLPVTYIGRPSRSSPATGDPIIHKVEQERIIAEALTIG